MKTKTEKVLPKMMPGTVHAQYVRCGKSNCKCADGELHGAYFYHFVRIGGQLKKRYIKASEVEQVKAACLKWQREQKKRIAASKINWQLLREIREQLGEIESFPNKQEI
jgi:hypothetical protein